MVGSHSNCLAEFVCKFLATILSAKGTPKVRKKKVFFGPKTPFLDLFNPFWSLFVHFKPVCLPIFLRRKMSAKGGLLWRTKSAKRYWKASLKAFLLNSLGGAYMLQEISSTFFRGRFTPRTLTLQIRCRFPFGPALNAPTKVR